MIADANGSVYDALADGIDFRATDSIVSGQFGVATEVHTGFVTSDNAYRVDQTATVFNEITRSNFVLMEYEISGANVSTQSVTALALACDFDFGGGEAIVQDGSDYIIRSSSFDRYIGIRILPGANRFGAAVDGSLIKTGSMTEIAKYSLLASGQTTLNPANGDNALLAGISSITATAGQTLRIGFAIASGNSIEEIRVALQAGEGAYNQATDVDDSDGPILPTDFTLQQNFPNPFNPETRIDFALPSAGGYRFEIVNSLGQIVSDIRVDNAAAGPHSILWNGKTAEGYDAASGIYFYRLTFGGNSQTRKMVLMK